MDLDESGLSRLRQLLVNSPLCLDDQQRLTVEGLKKVVEERVLHLGAEALFAQYKRLPADAQQMFCELIKQLEMA